MTERDEMITITGGPEAWPRCVLVAGGETETAEFEHMLEETEELIKACEMEPAIRMTQNMPNPHPGTYIGSGKLEELAELVRNAELDYVIFADNLSPAQLKNITAKVDAAVLDRTSLILEIFAKRAKTREARLQVELANLQYMLPRLVGMRTSLGRQGGASGSMSNKGSGEKQIELDRRRIEHRITELRRDLATIEQNREIQRKARTKANTPLVSLVGYTNAGKSTLMNHLVARSGGTQEKQVLEKNMLFATLDTTVRNISTGDKKDFLLSDTVGFISNLPHDLVQAFHSTLEEVKYADLLLLVVDASDAHYQEQLQVTEQTLKELGADGIPRIYVMNKVDLLRSDEADGGRITAIRPGQRSGENRIFLAAAKDEGIDELLTLIRQQVYGRNEILKMIFPYTAGGILGKVRANATVLAEEYREDGIYVEADCPDYLAGALRGEAEISIIE